MLFNTASMKIMLYFFNKPYEQIHLRELSRKTKTNIYTTKKIADELANQKILLEKRQGNQRIFQVNIDNQFFKQLKIAFSIKSLIDLQILTFLEEKIPAITSITLYGSTSQGKDDEKSDIDLLIIGQKTKIDISKFEKNLNKEINLLILKWSEWRTHAKQDKPFYREIIKDGISLLGEIPVIE